MEETDRETWVGENRCYLGEDGIVDVTIVGDIDDEMAILIREANFKFRDMIEGKDRVLCDMNRSGKHSPGARKIWKQMSEDEQAGKIALYGMHPVARVVVSFVMGITRNKDMRFFEAREEALAWLKGESS
jgi:hypothetical protein